MRSAVLSGLAVTAFTQDNLRLGMVALGAKQGFPALPKLDYTLAEGDADVGERGLRWRSLGGWWRLMRLRNAWTSR